MNLDARHELRAALCAVRLGVELAARGGELCPPRFRALELELDRAELALEELDGGAARLEYEPVNARELLADSVEAWRAFADARGVDLELRWSGPDALVLGDRIRLSQATGNLIANAIEHGSGPVAVRGRLVAGIVKIEVTDSGTGLPGAIAELVERAGEGRSHRGRGLAIASAVARAHGGRLASAPCGRGARLMLELPLLDVAADPSQRPKAAHAAPN